MNQQKYLVVNYTSVFLSQLLLDLGLTPQFIVNQNTTRENYHEFPLNPIKLVFHDYYDYIVHGNLYVFIHNKYSS